MHCLDSRPFMNDGIKLCALLCSFWGFQFWISNRGSFGKESSFPRHCHDFRLGPSESNCLTSVQQLDSVENKMISARLKSNATIIGSFRSCLLPHEMSETRACDEFPAHSTIGKAWSFSQRKWRCGKTPLRSLKWRTISQTCFCPMPGLPDDTWEGLQVSSVVLSEELLVRSFIPRPLYVPVVKARSSRWFVEVSGIMAI